MTTAPETDREHSHLRPQLAIGGHLLARNTAINLAGRILPTAVGVAALPYTIRHLGADRFGLLSLAWMVVGYFALFNLGIGPATTKFVAELLGKGNDERLPELVWTALISQTFLGVAAGIFLATATPILVSRLLKVPSDLHWQAELVFWILAVALPVDFATGSMTGVLGASQRFDLLNIVSIPSSTLNYLLPVVAIAFGYDLPWIVLLLVLARLAALSVLTLLSVRLYPSLRAGFIFNPRLAAKLLGFGGWVTVSSMIGPVLVYYDRLLLGSVVSIAAIGFYTPPYLISSKLGLLPGSLIAVLFPAFSAADARGDKEWIRNALSRSIKYLLLLVGPAALLLAFCARPLLTFWVGPRFADEGSLALQIFAVGALLNSLAFVPASLLQGTGRPDLTAKAHLVELPIHLGLSWLLVGRFGVPGAALAWTIRVSLDFLLLTAAACWSSGIPARLLAGKELRRSLATLMALATGLAGLWISAQGLVPEAVLTLSLGGGFFMIAWLYALDAEERWQIKIWLGAERRGWRNSKQARTTLPTALE